MNAVIPFAFEDNLVRAVWRDDDPWFVAADACKALKLSNPSMSIKALDEDERAKFNLGRQGEAAIVSEGGLYTLILRCRDATKPGTVPHRFRRWVTGEVLPALRKTGRYTMPGFAGSEPFDVPAEAHLRELSIKARLVEIAERVRGPAYAFALWRELGLPEAEPTPEDFELARARRGARQNLTAPGIDRAEAIAAVRAFIQEHRDSRFVPVRQAGADRTWARRNLAGFIGTRGDFLFLDEGWREATAGLDPLAAADALAEAGYLLKSPAGERKRAERVGSRTVRVYRVAETILNPADAESTTPRQRAA